MAVHDDRQYRRAEADRVTEDDNGRTHVAGVIAGKQIRLFVNGELQKVMAPITKFHPSRYDFMVGGNPEPDGADDCFNGQIREVRISRTARYRDSFIPPVMMAVDRDTTGLYRFDAGEGTAVEDLARPGVSAEIVGATWVEVK